MFGILFFNGDRPDIVFENGTQYGGLHCGDSFQYYNRRWLDVRLEYRGDWILVQGNRALPVVYGSKIQK